MEYFSTKYGLVTDNDPVTENGQLFLTELILLAGKSDPDYEDYCSIMHDQLQNSRVECGLYHRNPDLTHKRIMSHDNLSAIFSYSFVKDTVHRFTIWNYLLTHFGTYDNSRGQSEQFSKYLPFNPSNYFIWGLCAESSIYLLFLPFFLINMLLTCYKPLQETSGKILLWVELLPHKDHWLVKHFYRLYENRMKSQYGDDYVKVLMNIYHGNNSPEFPILRMVND